MRTKHIITGVVGAVLMGTTLITTLLSTSTTATTLTITPPTPVTPQMRAVFIGGPAKGTTCNSGTAPVCVDSRGGIWLNIPGQPGTILTPIDGFLSLGFLGPDDIMPKAIGSTHITSGAITTDKIVDNAITTIKKRDLNLVEDHFDPRDILGEKISLGSINSGEYLYTTNVCLTGYIARVISGGVISCIKLPNSQIPNGCVDGSAMIYSGGKFVCNKTVLDLLGGSADSDVNWNKITGASTSLHIAQKQTIAKVVVGNNQKDNTMQADLLVHNSLRVNTLGAAVPGQIYCDKLGRYITPGEYTVEKCALCDLNYTYNTESGMCEREIPVCANGSCTCIGTTPSNSTLCVGDDQGLISNTSKTAVTSCSNSLKCEYACRPGYVVQGNTCVLRKTLANRTVRLALWGDCSGVKNDYADCPTGRTTLNKTKSSQACSRFGWVLPHYRVYATTCYKLEQEFMTTSRACIMNTNITPYHPTGWTWSSRARESGVEFTQGRIDTNGVCQPVKRVGVTGWDGSYPATNMRHYGGYTLPSY